MVNLTDTRPIPNIKNLFRFRMPSINDKLVKSIAIPQQKLKMYWDDKITGFGIRVTNHDARSFVLRYVINGVDRIYTIGKFPELNSNAAREIAIKLKGEIIQGYDPLESKQKIRDTLTLKELSAEFLKAKESFLRPSTLLAYKENYLGKHILPKFGHKKINHITKQEIEMFINSLSKTPVISNRILELIKAIFSTAVSWNLIEKSPAQGIKKYAEHKREKYLNDAEIKRLAETLNKEENKLNVAAIKLILITGSRKSEVLSARWEDFDLERQLWTKPHFLTKQKKTSRIPLSTGALNIILELKKNIITDESKIKNNLSSLGFESQTISNETYLFYNPATKTHVKDIKRFWASVCEKANIINTRVHDLRHTFSSIIIDKGENLMTLRDLLGHADIRSTQRYTHLMNNTLRQAAERVGDIMN